MMRLPNLICRLSVQFQFQLVHMRVAGAQVLRHFGGSGSFPDKKLCILSVKARP